MPVSLPLSFARNPKQAGQSSRSMTGQDHGDLFFIGGDILMKQKKKTRTQTEQENLRMGKNRTHNKRGTPLNIGVGFTGGGDTFR